LKSQHLSITKFKTYMAAELKEAMSGRIFWLIRAPSHTCNTWTGKGKGKAVPVL